MSFQITKHLFNGLITNDKFCMTRTGQLQLNHWRRPLRLRTPPLNKRCTLHQRNLIAEVTMKRQWKIHREVQEYPNGQDRWDRAYLLILEIARNSEIDPGQPKPGGATCE
jgi:hypothetical protein